MSTKKRNQVNRGLSKRLYHEIISWGKVRTFTVDDFSKFNLPSIVIASALNYLVKEKELLVHGPMRGTWMLKRVEEISHDPVKIVIDNLLTAMAEAEPVLKKLVKIQALVKEI